MELVKRGWQLWWIWQDADGYHARQATPNNPCEIVRKTRHARDRFVNGTEYLETHDPHPVRRAIRGL